MILEVFELDIMRMAGLIFVLESFGIGLFLPQSASTITAPGWVIVLERGTTATSTSSSFLSPS